MNTVKSTAADATYRPLFRGSGYTLDTDLGFHQSPNYHVPTVNTHNSHGCEPQHNVKIDTVLS